MSYPRHYSLTLECLGLKDLHKTGNNTCFTDAAKQAMAMVVSGRLLSSFHLGETLVKSCVRPL